MTNYDVEVKASNNFKPVLSTSILLSVSSTMPLLHGYLLEKHVVDSFLFSILLVDLSTAILAMFFTS